MSTTRKYKILQDIDLSQNSLQNVSLINNDYNDESSINISSKKSLTESSKTISLLAKENEEQSFLNMSTTGSTFNTKELVVESDVYDNITANKITVGNVNSEVNVAGLNTLKITSKNDDNKSEIEVNNVNADKLDVNDIDTDKLSLNSELKIQNKLVIKWDDNTNSLLFTKVD